MDITIDPLEDRIRELETENSILRQQQIKITDAKELYLKIFEEFPALIWRSRIDKLCDYFNKTWLDFTGRTMEQEFGNGWAEGVHPEDYDLCLKTYVEAFDRREAFRMEYRMKNRFGEYRWIQDFGRPFYDLDNSFLGYIGSCYDITEIKDNELKLLEINRTKDKFFSIIAHDLQNPFNSIIGFSEQLMEMVEAKEYEKIGEFAGIISQSAGRAMDLLMNLLQWAQAQSGRMPFNPVSFDLNKIVSEAIMLLKGSAGQKSISIESALTPGVRVYADKSMISTVMRNLISNAVKFTSPGGKITVATSVKQYVLTITVSDTGVGISEERIGKLFGISESNSTQGTLNEKGTGLGLILSKEFIEKHGGKIEVTSEIGIGTTFSIILPEILTLD